MKEFFNYQNKKNYVKNFQKQFRYHNFLRNLRNFKTDKSFTILTFISAKKLT